MSEENIILQVNDVFLRFGGIRVLEGISLEVKERELIGIIGPNGAGKTALLNCINGFYRPQKGEIYFNGQCITRLASHRIAKLGISRTFQNLALYEGLTVQENLLAGRHFYFRHSVLEGFLYFGRAQREEIEQREVVEDIIELLELEPFRKKVVGTLGYGLRKRVELGRALALDPKLLLLDEPCSGMNVQEKEDMVRFILDIRELKKIPIVLVEHDMEVVMDICDRIIVLNYGQKIAEGHPEQVKKDPEVIKAYLGGG